MGPDSDSPTQSWNSLHGNHWGHWVVQVYKYSNYSDALLFCPTVYNATWFKTNYATTVAGGGFRSKSIDGHVWNREWSAVSKGSYGLNIHLQSYNDPELYGWRVSKFRDIVAGPNAPKDPYMVAAGGARSATHNFGGPSDKVLVTDVNPSNQSSQSTFLLPFRGMAPRHNGANALNVLYVDGHAKTESTNNGLLIQYEFLYTDSGDTYPMFRSGYSADPSPTNQNSLYKHWFTAAGNW